MVLDMVVLRVMDLVFRVLSAAGCLRVKQDRVLRVFLPAPLLSWHGFNYTWVQFHSEGESNGQGSESQSENRR